MGLKEGFSGVCREKGARFLWVKTERSEQIFADSK